MNHRLAGLRDAEVIVDDNSSSKTSQKPWHRQNETRPGSTGTVPYYLELQSSKSHNSNIHFKLMGAILIHL